MEDKAPLLKARHTGENELTHPMAHYLLSIHKLRETKGYARITDMAKSLGLTKGTVSMAVTNLKKKKLVQEEDESKFLFLTDEGHAEVHSILTSRTLLYYFFKDILGVSIEQAQKDSCLMEHLMGSETREKFFIFLKKHNDNIDLDIMQHDSLEKFMKSQTGDSYLPSEIM